MCCRHGPWKAAFTFGGDHNRYAGESDLMISGRRNRVFQLYSVFLASSSSLGVHKYLSNERSRGRSPAALPILTQISGFTFSSNFRYFSLCAVRRCRVSERPYRDLSSPCVIIRSFPLTHDVYAERRLIPPRRAPSVLCVWREIDGVP